MQNKEDNSTFPDANQQPLSVPATAGPESAHQPGAPTAELGIPVSSAAKTEAELEHLAPSVPLKPRRLAAFAISPSGVNESEKLPILPKINKPSKQVWFRTFPDEQMWPCFNTFTPEGDMNAIPYVLVPDVARVLGPVAKTVRFIPAVTLEGYIFFWPLTMSDKPNAWLDSARTIAGDAMTEWRRMAANASAQCYEAWKPTDPKPDPEWPSESEILDLFDKAVGSRLIESSSHPEIAKLF